MNQSHFIIPDDWTNCIYAHDDRRQQTIVLYIYLLYDGDDDINKSQANLNPNQTTVHIYIVKCRGECIIPIGYELTLTTF